MQPIDVIRIANRHSLKVDFVDYGISSRIGNTIIMNINMPKYEDFCRKVLDHEIRHSPKMTKKDLLMDMFEGSFINNMKFCLRHPKAFLQYVPFGKYDGSWFIDPNLIIVYVIAIIGVISILTMI